MTRYPPFYLTKEQQERFAEFCQRYYTSDVYKLSQQRLREIVRKNEERRYTLTVPKPTQEK